jgi:prepilin-type N-terminal cleavage/methylation domain-containing protein
MVQSTGMRNGISLVEMMIAIILFGVISVIGFQYYKNFMNTDLSAKKARVASLMDQARQLSNAYDVYQVQVGTAPTAITDLNASNVMIITEIPPAMTEVGAAQWTLDTTTDYTNTGNNDIAFVYAIDNVAASADNEEYCALFNNMIDPTISIDVSHGDTFDTSDDAYAALGSAFCHSSNAVVGSGTPAADGLEIVILKEAN